MPETPPMIAAMNFRSVKLMIELHPIVSGPNSETASSHRFVTVKMF